MHLLLVIIKILFIHSYSKIVWFIRLVAMRAFVFIQTGSLDQFTFFINMVQNTYVGVHI